LCPEGKNLRRHRKPWWVEGARFSKSEAAGGRFSSTSSLTDAASDDLDDALGP